LNKFNRHSGTWLVTAQYLKEQRGELLDLLVLQDSDIVRGKIQMIDDLLDFPSHQETE